MVEKKLSRKELLKSPDEFLTFTQKAANFVQAHSRKITMAVAALVVIILVVVGVNWYRQSQEQKALLLYNEALRSLPVTAAESDPAKYQTAIAILEPLTRQYKSTLSGRTALIDLGRSYYAIGEYDKALHTYELFLNNASTTAQAHLKPLVLSSMAYTLEAKGDLAEAAKRWRQVIDEPGDTIEQEAYLGLGRTYEALGQKQEALSAYRTFLETYPDSPQKDLAVSRMKILQE
jgi:tetratricopeptide (TPR) repeat protein